MIDHKTLNGEIVIDPLPFGIDTNNGITLKSGKGASKSRFQRIRYEIFPLDTNDDVILEWARKAINLDDNEIKVDDLTVRRESYKNYLGEYEAHDGMMRDLDLQTGEVGVVRFEDPIAVKNQIPSDEERQLGEEIFLTRKLISQLKRPWWTNPTHWSERDQVTVECPGCKSSLDLKWCGDGGRKNGHSYGNYCPVCDADLRPVEIRNYLDDLNAKYLEDVKKYRALKNARLHPEFLLTGVITIDEDQ